MPASVKIPRAIASREIRLPPPSIGEDLPLEYPTALQRAGYLIANPWRNFLLPAAWLRRLVSRSHSPLIAESLLRPGGWRAMEIIYRNNEPVDWLDRQAVRN